MDCWVCRTQIMQSTGEWCRCSESLCWDKCLMLHEIEPKYFHFNKQKKQTKYQNQHKPTNKQIKHPKPTKQKKSQYFCMSRWTEYIPFSGILLYFIFGHISTGISVPYWYKSTVTASNTLQICHLRTQLFLWAFTFQFPPRTNLKQHQSISVDGVVPDL